MVSNPIKTDSETSPHWQYKTSTKHTSKIHRKYIVKTKLRHFFRSVPQNVTKSLFTLMYQENMINHDLHNWNSLEIEKTGIFFWQPKQAHLWQPRKIFNWLFFIRILIEEHVNFYFQSSLSIIRFFHCFSNFPGGKKSHKVSSWL